LILVEGSVTTREKRLRRAAARQGLRLAKSARRNPDAEDFGKYRIENPQLDNAVVAGGSPFDYSLDLDDVEEALAQHGEKRPHHPLQRDEDYENAITPHAPHDGHWRTSRT
jgi:hypothetical protein